MSKIERKNGNITDKLTRVKRFLVGGMPKRRIARTLHKRRTGNHNGRRRGR